MISEEIRARCGIDRDEFVVLSRMNVSEDVRSEWLRKAYSQSQQMAKRVRRIESQ